VNELYGGLPPYERTSGTSREAAISMLPYAGHQRERVYRYVCSQGDTGATSDECEIALDLPHQSASARVRELVLEGLVVESGEKRRTRTLRRARVVVAAHLPLVQAKLL